MALVCSLKLFRPRDDDPGLREAEGGFIRLLDRLTNGSQVNDSSDSITYTCIVYTLYEGAVLLL